MIIYLYGRTAHLEMRSELHIREHSNNIVQERLHMHTDRVCCIWCNNCSYSLKKDGTRFLVRQIELNMRNIN